jgi:hypothetical protein
MPSRAYVFFLFVLKGDGATALRLISRVRLWREEKRTCCCSSLCVESRAGDSRLNQRAPRHQSEVRQIVSAAASILFFIRGSQKIWQDDDLYGHSITRVLLYQVSTCQNLEFGLGARVLKRCEQSKARKSEREKVNREGALSSTQKNAASERSGETDGSARATRMTAKDDDEPSGFSVRAFTCLTSFVFLHLSRNSSRKKKTKKPNKHPKNNLFGRERE